MKLTGGVVALLLLGGCSSAAPAPSSAPTGQTDGVERQTCGTVTLEHGQTVPDDAIACLRAAVGTTAAELVVTRLTTEGDPVTSYFRTSADRERITVYVDATQDSFGSRKWMTLQCPADVDPMTMTGCTE